MMATLDEQLAEFASLGEVFDPNGSLEAKAVEVAEVLMRQQLAFGPLERIKRLTNLLKVLRRVTRIVTAQRDLAAYVANAMWPYRKLAVLADATPSTMQRWVEVGRKAVEASSISA